MSTREKQPLKSPIRMNIPTNNIVLFDIGEIPYDPDYIRRHPDDFDEWGNHIYVDDDDD